MRLRKRHLPLLALVGASVAVVPTIASSETAPVISAYNEPGSYGGHSWMPSSATIDTGGVVKFANPSNAVPHGLQFTGGTAGATPSCTGIPAAAGEPTGATSWQGECTFSKPGTYTFICTVHPGEMKGTITVNPGGTTTTTTTTSTTTPTTTPTPPVESSSRLPLVGSPAIRATQRGGIVKGSLDIASAGAGDRLEVDVFAKRTLLAKAGRSTRVRVGRFVRGSVPAGRLSFAVKLDARARSALRRHRRLALTVRITLTPAHGEPTTVTRFVVEHG